MVAQHPLRAGVNSYTNIWFRCFWDKSLIIDGARVTIQGNSYPISGYSIGLDDIIIIIIDNGGALTANGGKASSKSEGIHFFFYNFTYKCMIYINKGTITASKPHYRPGRLGPSGWKRISRPSHILLRRRLPAWSPRRAAKRLPRQ